MSNYPPKLAELVDDFSMITDRTERQEYLIEIADRFLEVKVPPDVATKTLYDLFDSPNWRVRYAGIIAHSPHQNASV